VRATAAFGGRRVPASPCAVLSWPATGERDGAGRGDGLAAMAGERAVGRNGAELAQAGSAPGREGGWPCGAMAGRVTRTSARPAGAELSRAACPASPL